MSLIGWKTWLVAALALLACGRPSPPTESGEPVDPGPGALPSATVEPRVSAAPSNTPFRSILHAERCSLVPGHRSFLLQWDGAWLEPTAQGFVRRPEIEQADLGSGDDEDREILLGRTPVLSVKDSQTEQVRYTRLDGSRRHPIAVDGAAREIAVAPDGAEVWITSDRELRHRIHWIESARPGLLQEPARIGPDVPGLSEIGEKNCARPTIAGVAVNRSEAVALVLECHIETPVRLVHYARPALAPREERLPAPATGFSPKRVRLLDDGGIVVSGTIADRPTIARPDSGTWKSISSDTRIVYLLEMLSIDASGHAWIMTLGQGLDGHDDWAILREQDGRLERVPLIDPSGAVVRPDAFGFHPTTGIAVCGSSPGGAWLFAQAAGLAITPTTGAR